MHMQDGYIIVVLPTRTLTGGWASGRSQWHMIDLRPQAAAKVDHQVLSIIKLGRFGLCQRRSFSRALI